jgi:hypothetical protein
MRQTRNCSLIVIIALLSLFAVSAGLWAQQTQPPNTVTITSPHEGQQVVGPDVTIQLQASGIEIKKANGQRTPGVAHFHLFLDTPLPQATDQPYPAAPGSIHTAENSYTFKGLKTGDHTLIVALGDGAHYPLNPPVTATVHFTVVAPQISAAGISGIHLSYLALLLLAAIIFVLTQIL